LSLTHLIWRCSIILNQKIISKKEDWNFLDFGEIKINKIYEEVTRFYSEWLIDTSRQNFFETHRHTFSYEMMSMDYMTGIDLPLVCQIKRSLVSSESNIELQNIYDNLEQLVNGKIIRSEFISMNPKSRIRTHKDRSDILYVARRFHIPIKTNAGVIFITNGETRHLEQGRMYELNNIKYHSVYNNSDQDRIHLIVDVLPKKYCNRLEYTNEA